MDTAVQKLRIQGYRYHTIPTRVWCTAEFHSNVVKASNLNEEIIQKLCIECSKVDFTNSFDSLKNMRISNAKMSNKPLGKFKMPMKKIFNDKDDFFKSVNTYDQDIEKTTACVSRKKVHENSDIEFDKKSLLKSMARAYNKSGSKVQLIIDLFKQKNWTCLSKQEIISSHDSLSKINLTNYDTWKSGRSAKYKILEKTSGSKYVICQEIIEYLRL